jgi:hypothetical protein
MSDWSSHVERTPHRLSQAANQTHGEEGTEGYLNIWARNWKWTRCRARVFEPRIETEEERRAVPRDYPNQEIHVLCQIYSIEFNCFLMSSLSSVMSLRLEINLLRRQGAPCY